MVPDKLRHPGQGSNDLLVKAEIIYFYTVIFMHFLSMMTGIILLPYMRLELETYVLKVLNRVTLEAENKIHSNIQSAVLLVLNNPGDFKLSFMNIFRGFFWPNNLLYFMANASPSFLSLLIFITVKYGYNLESNGYMRLVMKIILLSPLSHQYFSTNTFSMLNLLI